MLIFHMVVNQKNYICIYESCCDEIVGAHGSKSYGARIKAIHEINSHYS